MSKKMGKLLAPACLAIAGLGASVGHAAMLLAQTTLITGTEQTVSTFNAPGKGTVSVVLADLNWPDQLSSLSFAATTATSVLARLEHAGSISFDVSGPGMYSAVVSGTVAGTGAFDLGMYSLKLDFAPAVPLPPSIMLLLSGLGAFAAAWASKKPLASLQPPDAFAAA